LAGAPPSVPQLKSWLGDAIRRLYVSKIPPPPSGLPLPPPLPVEKPLASQTRKGAPIAPRNVVIPPPIDPSIVRRNQ